jgi:hypothetical protein
VVASAALPHKRQRHHVPGPHAGSPPPPSPPLLGALPVAAQTAPVWHHTFHAIMRGATPLANGYLGVLTDSGLSLLAPEDGQESWRMPGACCVRGSHFSNLMVVIDRDRGGVVEIDRGEVQWHLRGLPINGLAGLRASPDRNLLLVYGLGSDSVFRLVAASLDSGVVRWQDDSLFTRVPDLRRK